MSREPFKLTPRILLAMALITLIMWFFWKTGAATMFIVLLFSIIGHYYPPKS